MIPYAYPFETLNSLLFNLLVKEVPSNVIEWLNEISHDASDEKLSTKFKMGFSMISRKVPKSSIELSPNDEDILRNDFGILISSWSLQKLCRIWLILQINSDNKEKYIQKLNDLFDNADMNELAVLYSSLPFLAYPEHWKLRCAEGIRSNIGIVLDAIILENPYPSRYLDESAWNQMILKAFFTDKDVNKVIGVKDRANHNLALALKDYVKERQAANRPVKKSLREMININDKI